MIGCCRKRNAVLSGVVRSRGPLWFVALFIPHKIYRNNRMRRGVAGQFVRGRSFSTLNTDFWLYVSGKLLRARDELLLTVVVIQFRFYQGSTIDSVLRDTLNIALHTCIQCMYLWGNTNAFKIRSIFGMATNQPTTDSPWSYPSCWG